MKRLGIKRISFLLLIIAVFSAFSTTINASYIDDGAEPAIAENGEYIDCFNRTAVSKDDVNVSSRIYELLFGKDKKKSQEIYLIPGGDVFGIKMKEAHVTVSGAKDGSALKKGDKILAINGSEIKDTEDVNTILDGCGGGAVKLDIIRGGEKMSITVMPKFEDGSYKLGVTLRKLACGIGTVTFIDPKTKIFGGLGHGVCEAESGKLVEISSGEVTGVVLGGVTRGEVGKPGELSGVLNKKRAGSIEKNDECGVFGVLDNANTDADLALQVGHKSELKLGEAEIISTVKTGKKARYKIEITEIDLSSEGSKSFKIKVTDPMLITLTGGIVRGMSGSPIIQNGKLVGAVTHVMVANPTEGYGIFIENMLNASVARGELPKSA